MALLLVLLEANVLSPQNKAPLGIVLSAAHVHHGLRGVEADGDEAFVRDLCQKLNVPLKVFRVDTAARQAESGEGVEEAARELRYAALEGLMAEKAADVVVTAHTLDDQAETVMMKLLRGAWTEGLGGVSPVKQEGLRRMGQGTTGRVVRPFLQVRRKEIEAFLLAREQSWREDSSNRDLSLTRNRVRHELMPMLRSFNPGIDFLLARMAEVARDEETFWRGEVERLLPLILLPGKPVRGGGRAVSTVAGEAGNALEIDRLKGMAAALRRRVVRAAAKSLGYRLNSEETVKLLALAGFGSVAEISGRVGSKLELSGGLRAERSARELRLWREG